MRGWLWALRACVAELGLTRGLCAVLSAFFAAAALDDREPAHRDHHL